MWLLEQEKIYDFSNDIKKKQRGREKDIGAVMEEGGSCGRQ